MYLIPGCDVDYDGCERPCVTERWWSDWSEWVKGRSNIRFRSWCSLGDDGRSLVTVLINESTSAREQFDQWSDWKIRPGVAFRYRLPPEVSLLHSNAAVDIQYQILATASTTRVTLSFCLYLSTLTMLSGFFAQCLITKLFSSCRASKTSFL
ncbi:hypothetical protein GCK32_009825 [Trichostrongylus colubriformis]|uniref:Uncharacterized protein n=1 Tax=Trichostrongylus colubriformis TaxID=6319 RepID=A0AAN8FH31_TRICO